MSKASRRQQRTGSTPQTPPPAHDRDAHARRAAAVAQPHRHGPGRRRAHRATRPPERSFVERYRTAIVGVVVVAAVALIGGFVFVSASRRPSPARRSGRPQPDRRARRPARRTRLATSSRTWAAATSSTARRDLPVLRTGLRLALQQGRRRARSSRGSTARTTRSSRRAGSTTWSTARSWSSTRAPATARRRRASSSSRRSTTRSRTARSATSRRARPWVRSSPASTRWRPTTRPSSGAGCCRSQTFDTAAILDFYETWGERTNPEQQCTPTRAPRPVASPSVVRRARAPSASPSDLASAQRRTVRQPELTARPMLALVKTAAGPGLDPAGRPDAGRRHQRRPDPGPSDRHLRHRPAHRVVGRRGRPTTIVPPLVVGHEFVGEIVEVGSNVDDFHPGDLVSRRGPRRLRPVPALPGRPAATCAPARSGWASGATARSPSTSSCR